MNNMLLFSLVLITSLIGNGATAAWSGWSTSIDESVGCPAFPATRADISTHIDRNDILTLTANAQRKNGLFIDAIVSRSYNFQDNSRYIYSGSFRKVPGSSPEQIDINLQLVDNYVEHYAEIIWTLNPYSPLYGWVWTRGANLEIHKLFYVPDDTQWHRFVLIADYRQQPPARLIRRLQLDGHIYEASLEMGTAPKKWADSFTTMIETHNTYTRCTRNVTFVGKSQWRNIQLARMPLH